ncbi:phage gp45-like [Bosea sp. OAE506]|uniref:phage baseplate assembly protein domain-containing protein n=1 Tax=Bosea sp. OAE506 TaxID=2663870 RepID=UPI001789D3A6
MPSEFWTASEVTTGRVKSIDDSGDNQKIVAEGYKGERFTEVVRAQPHGFSSHPPVDAVGHILRFGSSDRVIALGFETPGRPKSLPAGACVLYDSAGNVIFARAAEGIRLKAVQGGVMVEAETGTIELKRGDMRVIVSEDRVDLGGPGGSRVVTLAGPSTKVFAIL